MNPRWLFNEMRPSGTDYTDLKNVQEYDEKMKKIRNVAQESAEIIAQLGLTSEHTVVDFGSGTGEFAIHAAEQCKMIYAVDVSPAMLAFARLKADRLGIPNIKFTNAGFLTYNHSAPAVDAIVSQLTLHHLPDFWKQIALTRLYGMLKQNGKLYIKDTVYSFSPAAYEEFFESWVRETGEVDPGIANEVIEHIRDEYATSGTIMEGIITQAGFVINKADYKKGFLAEYYCTKAG